MSKNQKTLLWVGLGIAALYFIGRQQAQAGGGMMQPIDYGGAGFGTGSPLTTANGSPVTVTPGLFPSYIPAGLATGSPTAGI